MAELVPVPLSHHVSRILAEWRGRRTIFDLPERSFWKPDPARDLSVRFHGDRAATPAGPAAGPQSQMAQNLVLAWLAGSRILELKTVQENDRLVIARRLIDERRAGLPRDLRDLPIEPRIGRSVTLSTFHGCPADEIEKICEFLLAEVGVHTIVKMNPTLLGLEEVRHLLHGVLGYEH